MPKTFYTFTDKNNLAEFLALDSSMITGDCCGFFSSRNEYTEAEKKEHLDWLKSKLQASTAKWKIVLLHHPLYSSSRRHGVRIDDDRIEKIPREMIDIRKIENDLKQYGVKLVLAAHDHVYERIKPQHGVAHYVAGAGSELRENDLDRRLPSFHGCGEARKNSFMLFSVKPGSISFWTIDLNGVVFDSGVLNP